MIIYIEKENKKIEYKLDKEIKISQILKELKITNSSVIIQNTKGDILLENQTITPTEKTLNILSVVSGG
jgi:sulfur carrier protein ThiS